MEEIKRLRKTDLARHTRQVIREVQRGQTAIVESHGQPEVAILDIIDYRILRAVMRYYTHHPKIDVEAGLIDGQLAGLATTPACCYLAGAISLGRAAELLDLPRLDVRTRFLRLDVPLRTAPVDLEEAQSDIEAAAS